MIILGVHDGHTATACVLEDGAVLAMASEERFRRVKSCGGVPTEAIRWVLDHAGKWPTDIDAVALCGIAQPVLSWEASEGIFRRRLFNVLTRYLPPRLAGSERMLGPYLWAARRAHFRTRAPFYGWMAQLGIPGEKVHVVEHHHTHAATAYLGAPACFRQGPALLITLDSSGDGLSGSVSVGEGGAITRLGSWASYHSLGELYSRTTHYLGMKPAEHEYKVMGLAPYAPEELAERAYARFRRYIGLGPDGLSLQNTSGAWGASLSARLLRELAGLRFDGIAAALQRRAEEVIVELVRNWIRKTGIRNVAVAGGVFMNIKANMLLTELPEVERLFVFPSCGDESTPLGAALSVYMEEREKSAELPPPESLEDIYWGPGYSETEVEAALAKFADRICWERIPDIEERVVDLLARGKVVARFAGRMEWGARALGNRSILADPRDVRIVRRINDAIKQRDFWMPFAPSILWERRNDYLVNAKNFPSPHMMIGFRTTRRAQKEIPAALHPKDLTCRPQIVEERLNAHYHKLLRCWEKKTDCGALLNTSFNIHGEPIVCSAEDSIDTLLRSQLDFLALEQWLVWPKGRPHDRETE